MELQIFYSLSDLVVQHDKTFCKKKTAIDLLFINSRRGESSKGRGIFNENSRGHGTSRGRRSYDERRRGIFNNQECGGGHGRSQERRRYNQNKKFVRRSQDPPHNKGKSEDMMQVKCKRCLHIGHVVEEYRI